MNFDYAIQEANDALDVLLSLDLTQEDIDSIKMSVQHAIAYGHVSPIEAAIILSALNNY